LGGGVTGGVVGGGVTGGGVGAAQAAIKGSAANTTIKQTLPISANNFFFFTLKNSFSKDLPAKITLLPHLSPSFLFLSPCLLFRRLCFWLQPFEKSLNLV